MTHCLAVSTQIVWEESLSIPWFFLLVSFWQVVALSVFLRRRLLSYLHYLQQDQYSPRRFFLWLKRNKVWDRKGTLMVGVGWLVGLFFASAEGWVTWAQEGVLLLLGVGWIALRFQEIDPRKKAVLTLKMTPRACRLHRVAWSIACIATLLVFVPLILASGGLSPLRTSHPSFDTRFFRSSNRGFSEFVYLDAFPSAASDQGSFSKGVVSSVYFSWTCWMAALIVLVQGLPLSLVGAYYLLWPMEKTRERRWFRQARNCLQGTLQEGRGGKPIVIGITGSYGKTTTKEALGQLLQLSLGPTFWPSQGINTLMGNIQAIREELHPYHEYGVIEMGAYRKGTIRRLCDLTSPSIGLITGIGYAHLERYGSQQAIQQAKGELAEALPPEGVLVINGDDPLAREIGGALPHLHVLAYGLGASLDCSLAPGAIDAVVVGEPLYQSFTIQWEGVAYSGKTGLMGHTALHNLAGAWTVGAALGAKPIDMLAACEALRPTPNRLQIETTEKVTILRDAYNANPIGLEAALDTLTMLKGKRRIVMTPGMVELGSLQNQENRAIGRKIAQACDLSLIVGKTNQQALARGLAEGGMASERILFCSSRKEAFAQLKELESEGDLVLIANDLPDLYMNTIRF